MGAAKEELRSALDSIDEGHAELMLSFLHLLRAVGEERGGAAEASVPRTDVSLDTFALALLLEHQRRSGGDLARLVRLLSEREDVGWIGLSERSLAREWDRPEEDEAWENL